MIAIKMVCNIKNETELFHANAHCEIDVYLNDRVKIFAKNKEGKHKTAWMAKNNIFNLRYMAWYNGVKEEFKLAKKLAKMATIIYNATGQDFNLIGNHELEDIKKLIDELGPTASYYENYRSR